jgi:hypothetical protein
MPPVQIIRWRCGHPGCDRSAQGVGTARGLRVIGWQVEAVETSDKLELRCPQHHPDGIHASVAQAERMTAIAGVAHNVRNVVRGASEIVGYLGGE